MAFAEPEARGGYSIDVEILHLTAMAHSDPKEIAALIAQGHELAARARQMVDQSREFLAQRGITPDTCMDELRRVGGEEAVKRVLREAEELNATMEQELQRDRMHRGRSTTAARSMQMRRARV